MRIFKYLFMLTLLFCLIYPAWSGGNKEADTIKEIEASLADYGKYLMEGDYEKWGELHSEDVIKMPPDAPPTRNREDLVANASKDKGVVQIVLFDVNIQETKVYGDIAHAWGLYKVEIQVLNGGPLIKVDGKFLTIYRKEKDGRWVITHDCFNSNVPPAK